MTVQEIFDLIKDIRPGVWKIGVTYKSDLKVLTRGAAAKAARANGITDGDYYKVVFRWCSANVNRKNTKSWQDARQNAIDRAAAQGKTFTPRASGFHDSTNEEELNIIEYKDGTNEPCLILKHGPNPDKAKYYFRGTEIPESEVRQLMEDGVLSKTSISRLEPNAVFNLYPDKVQSLKIDGILHKELEENVHMNEDNQKLYYIFTTAVGRVVRDAKNETMYFDSYEAAEKWAKAYLGNDYKISETTAEFEKKAHQAIRQEVNKINHPPIKTGNTMNEARFNGIVLPNEDGFYSDVEEELCEDDETEDDPSKIADYYLVVYNDHKTTDIIPGDEFIDAVESTIDDWHILGIWPCDMNGDSINGDYDHWTEEEGYIYADGTREDEFINESLQSKVKKTVITESMNKEARKYGYKNYNEYLSSNK